MSKIRYTDSIRYPNGYSRTTDLRQTFERERKKIKLAEELAEKNAAEQKIIVTQIKKKAIA